MNATALGYFPTAKSQATCFCPDNDPSVDGKRHPHQNSFANDSMDTGQNPFLNRKTLIAGALLLLNSAILLGAADASLFFVGNILLHLVLGPAAVVAWYRLVGKGNRSSMGVRLGVVLAALTGLAILLVGNTNDTQIVVVAHVVVGATAAILAVVWILSRTALRPGLVAGGALLLLLAGVLPALKGASDSRDQKIVNAILPPHDLAGEAMDGREGPFFPSAAETSTKDLIPGDFFLKSETCAQSGCHEDAFDQWKSSAHHFSSFNNPWYSKSIEYMQDVVGTRPPQWCAGCHDPALLFSGQMNQPVDSFVTTPEAQAGLACVACHSIASVKNTMGNGGYVLEYPAMHRLATSTNPIIKTVHDLIIRANPEPHRRTFLKDFHVEQSDKFCVSCHKVHLDTAVNNYRWVRGFNTYDNWQASGVSGDGARSFYDPPFGRTCVDCHMQRVPSEDAGNDDGTIPSHRFAVANTAIPALNEDTVQLDAVKGFLKADQLLVDIFSFSESAQRASAEAESGQEPAGKISTTFAVGEEQAMGIGRGSATREAVNFVSPLDPASAVLTTGSSIRLDVVVRTLGIGHFFPSGTIDAQEAWVELKAVDASGEPVFWSGWVEDDGTGPVDSSAHFFRSVILDAHGNAINKRNAFASRSVAYVNLIPPSAADVVHYRIRVPDEPGTLTVTANVHYRKFNWSFNQFTFNGVTTDSDSLKSPHYDDRHWSFNDGLDDAVTLPIVTMASDSVVFQVVADRGAASVASQVRATEKTKPVQVRRMYDYGIGLFREGDLRSAEVAFERAQSLDSININIPINLARVYLADGALQKARQAVAVALAINSSSPKAHYFNGLVEKSSGNYAEALASFELTESKFPRDRVVLNQIGRVLFLDSRPSEAIDWFIRVLEIDPEDLMAHYNLMLCYRAIGNEDLANQHESRYLRYKADERAPALALRYLQKHPFDNNEAVPIHEHSLRMPKP